MNRVIYFADPIGSLVNGPSFEEEGKECRRIFKRLVFGKDKFSFLVTCDSLKIVEEKYDILIFDFGGIGLGATDLARSLAREILKLIEDRPNTLFIAWTYFTNEYLEQECEKELGIFPNLFIRDMNTEEMIKKVKAWIS